MNIIDFNEEEQIKKDIEAARINVDNSPSVQRPTHRTAEVKNDEEETITK